MLEYYASLFKGSESIVTWEKLQSFGFYKKDVD